MQNEFTSRSSLPNPLRRGSSIEFRLPTDARVTLKIFDLSGQELDTLLNHKYYHHGIHYVNFDPAKYSSAIRLYRLSMESEGQTHVEVKRLL